MQMKSILITLGLLTAMQLAARGDGRVAGAVRPGEAGDVKQRGQDAPALTPATTVVISAPGDTPTTAPPGDPGHAGLGVSKSGGSVLLEWNGTGPFDVTRSTDPSFIIGDVSLAIGTSAFSLTDSNGFTLVFYDVSARGLGETSAAVRGSGIQPPIPPVITSITGTQACSARPCAYVWDNMVVRGNNFDPLSVANGVFFNQIQTDVVADIGNGPIQLTVRVPKSSSAAGLATCSSGLCTSTNPYNADVLIIGPEKGKTDISSNAFDDNRDASGQYRLNFAVRGAGSGIYWMDAEIPHGAAPLTTINTTISQPIIPTMTYRDGALTAVSQTGGTASDQISLFTRASSGVFATTRDASTDVCLGVADNIAPLPYGITLNPNESSTTTGKFSYLCDGNSGYVRGVLEGTQLTTPTGGNIDGTFGGLNFGLFHNPCPIQVYPVTGNPVWAFKPNGNSFTLSGTVCGATAATNKFTSGNFVYTATLNERMDFLWFLNNPNYRSWSFAQDRNHYGYMAVARSDYIIRGNDLEIFITPFDPAPHVLISKLGSEPWPDPRQTQPRQYKIDIQLNQRVNTPVYLRVIDPPDGSGYNTRVNENDPYPIGRCAPFASGKTCDSDPTVAMQACDNRSWCDANDDFGLIIDAGTTPCPGFVPPPLNGTIQKAACLVVDGTGHTTITLETTGRHSGDNYKIQGALSNFITGSSNPIPNPNAHVKWESSIITAWKRIYIEQDRMFRKGALLEDDFNPGGCGGAGQLACNQLVVFDWTNVAVNDRVILFQSNGTAAQTETAPITITAIIPGPRTNSKTITLDKDLNSLNISWLASVITAPTGNPSQIDFQSGKSAALGVISGCSSFNYPQPSSGYPADCYFEANARLVPSTMADAYIEYMFPSNGNGAVPYLAPAVLDLYTPATIDLNLMAPFSKQWFKSAPRDGGGNITYNNNNYFHLMGFSIQSPVAGTQTFGYTSQNRDWSLVFVKSTEDLVVLALPSQPVLQGQYASAMIEENTTHEIGGHPFWVNACMAGDPGHSTDDAWCEIFNHCDANPVGNIPKKTVMDETVGVYISQRSDGIARFSVNELLTAPVCPAPQNGADTRAIRTHHDPE